MAGCLRRVVLFVLVLLALAALLFFGLLGVGARVIFGAAEETPFTRGITAVRVDDEPDVTPLS
jgi:hypothetical protein